MFYVQTLVSVLFVLAVGSGLYYLTHRLKGRLGQRGRSIEIVESVALGSQGRLVLVKVAGQEYLVGSTAHQISMLAPVNETGDHGDIPAAEEATPHTGPVRVLKGTKH